MESKKITAALSAVLLVACVIVAVVLASVNKRMNHLPDTAVDDMIGILYDSGIHVSREIIDTKRENGDVYLFDSDTYYETVAKLLGGEETADSFATPDGVILELENGALFEFGKDFYFRYSIDGEKHPVPDFKYMVEAISSSVSGYKHISDAAVNYLDKGSREFTRSSSISIVTETDVIYGDGEKYYIVCSRKMDGVEITGNSVVCTYENGVITAAEGTWCFFTEGESYSAQLTDHLNILFNARNDITVSGSRSVVITSIEPCYSMYYYGEGEDFCLIPCWKVSTDKAGEYIYNALNGTLYTKN